MKVKVSGRLRRMLPKHFITRNLPQLVEPIEADLASISEFWQECSREFKLSSLCFFSPDLIDLVNKTNSKLLYAELLAKATQSAQKKRQHQLAPAHQSPQD